MKIKALVKKRPMRDMDGLSMTDPEKYSKIYAVLSGRDDKKDLLDMVETVPLHYAYNIPDTSPSPEDITDATKLKSDMKEALSKLDWREEKILSMRFGIGVLKDHRLEEVGNVFGVRSERIRQLEAKALRKLRHPYNFENLRDHLHGDRV